MLLPFMHSNLAQITRLWVATSLLHGDINSDAFQGLYLINTYQDTRSNSTGQSHPYELIPWDENATTTLLTINDQSSRMDGDKQTLTHPRYSLPTVENRNEITSMDETDPHITRSTREMIHTSQHNTTNESNPTGPPLSPLPNTYESAPHTNI